MANEIERRAHRQIEKLNILIYEFNQLTSDGGFNLDHPRVFIAGNCEVPEAQEIVETNYDEFQKLVESLTELDEFDFEEVSSKVEEVRDMYKRILSGLYS